MLGESIIPGPCISSRNTVVIRLGARFWDATSPWGLARGVGMFAARPPKAPREMPFPKLRRDKSFIRPPSGRKSSVESFVQLEVNSLPNELHCKLDLARSIDC